MAKEKWIQKATKSMERRGTVGVFTAKARKAHMSTQAFANKVMANKEDFSTATVRQANFARNVSK